MHLAYSALEKLSHQTAANTIASEEFILRLKAYLATCEKYNKEIAAIRKYIPGWMPERPITKQTIKTDYKPSLRQ